MDFAEIDFDLPSLLDGSREDVFDSRNQQLATLAPAGDRAGSAPVSRVGRGPHQQPRTNSSRGSERDARAAGASGGRRPSGSGGGDGVGGFQRAGVQQNLPTNNVGNKKGSKNSKGSDVDVDATFIAETRALLADALRLRGAGSGAGSDADSFGGGGSGGGGGRLRVALQRNGNNDADTIAVSSSSRGSSTTTSAAYTGLLESLRWQPAPPQPQGAANAPLGIASPGGGGGGVRAVSLSQLRHDAMTKSHVPKIYKQRVERQPMPLRMDGNLKPLGYRVMEDVSPASAVAA
jgi:hypothetical protein